MTINFQSLHAPRGANAHFALGLFGGGGFAHESDRAASNDVFIGWKRGNQVACFPFFRNAQSAELAGFIGEQVKPSQLTISAFTESQIERDFRWATDTWRAPRLSFSIATPVSGIDSPLPAGEGPGVRASILPALPARLTLDNRDSAEPLQGFFAVTGLRGAQLLPERNEVQSKGDLTGWQTIQGYGFASRPAPNLRAVSHWDLPSLFTPPHPLPFPLTGMGVLLVDVPAGETFTLDFVLGWYRGGLVTAGEKKLTYAYTRHYADLPEVLSHALDLAIDHIFYEFDHQPWVVRNLLDHFADEYSYTDQCGLSFTHDQGAYNTFSSRGYSSYEVSGQEGCYAYMTQEQLLNWILAAGLYLHKTGDRAWAETRRDLFARCLDSMLQRDHPDPAQRNGVMDIDSSRAAGASEITTYDSLDPSLSQARRNLYLAVKGYAAYLALAWLFDYLAEPEKAHSARLAAQTVIAAFDPALGYIPALLDGIDRSPIIPAVEGLVYPHRMGIPLDSDLTRSLHTHLETILVPGVCIFDDGGWKLSAHSTNSWMSKIFLAQYVAENILGFPADPRAD